MPDLTIHEALVAHLRADAAIQSLAGDRIYPSVLPENSVMPALTYHLVDGANQHVARYIRASFWFSCWSYQRGLSWMLARAVRNALENFHGDYAANVHAFSLVENWYDDYEADSKLYPVRVHARIWYQEPAA